MKKPRLLIAGGSHSEIPLIHAAKQLGFHTITSGYRAHDRGHLYSDEVHLEDYSDKDAMLELASRLSIDAICASSNDFSALTAAYVANELKLPGYDLLQTSETLHHKDKFRKFAKSIGVKTPRVYEYRKHDDLKRVINDAEYPIIIKPVDLTGGKGIGVARTPTEAMSMIEKALQISRAKRVIIEDYIAGSDHGFTAIIKNQRVAFYFADDEFHSNSPFEISATTSPSSCRETTISRLIQDYEKIAGELSLCDGILHGQFIEPNYGDPVIIEICRRSPGDLQLELIRHATISPISKWIIQGYVGQNITTRKRFSKQVGTTRYVIVSDTNGYFTELEIDKSLTDNIIDQSIWVDKGTQMFATETKVGAVFIRHNSLDEKNEVVNNLSDLIRVKGNSDNQTCK